MFSNKKIYQVDAFTEVPFKGNPAAIMVLENEVAENWMQSVASEMNLSETAFVLKKGDLFEIRYFTPTVEIPLCGHATLASAHILFELGIVNANDTIKFQAKGGLLLVKNIDGYIAMEFPEYNFKPIKVPNHFKELVGFQPSSMYKSDGNWVIAIAESQEQIRICAPKFQRLETFGLGHLIITAASTDSTIDFVVRCFVPETGINEDPVTGSAHCVLAPLWSGLLNKTNMTSHQISKRGGKLLVSYRNNSVEIKGKATTIFEGFLKI
jgi:PhzF family phenazine biosynthesis protein